jgi:predicted glycosyltransferase
MLREQQLRFPGVVTIIEPWESINSYELAILSDKVISFRGTMPLEVSLLGIRPIVLARDKGIMNYWIQLGPM